MNQQLLSEISKHISKTRNRQIAVAVGLFIFAAFCIFVGLAGLDPSADTATNIGIIILGSTAGFFGLVILAIAAKTLNVENSEIIQTLKKNPRKIVWVYTVQYTNETTKNLNTDLGKQSLVVLSNDEGNIAFQFQTSPSTAEEILKVLEEALPHATFGYTEEIAQKYQNSPTSLRK